MNDNKSTAASGGIGFTGLLTIVFIVLKLLGVISWSWWWVLSPLWISTALAIAIILVVLIVVIIIDKVEERTLMKTLEKKRKKASEKKQLDESTLER